MTRDRVRAVRFLLVTFVAAWAAALAGNAKIRIREGDYEGRRHFVVEAGRATWYFDAAGGGFSRLIDRDGRDWIAFHMLPDKGPAGSAGKYRGMPNLVFGVEYAESGAGHPGFNHCETVQVGRDTLRSTTHSGKWAWTWKFTKSGAKFHLEKADPDHPWWFIYEGPIGGKYAPHATYFGSDRGGPRRESRNYKLVQEIAEEWSWAYFGAEHSPRVLAIAHAKAEPLPAVLGFLGSTEAGLDAPDGMVVFGFGRDRSRPFRPLLTGWNHSFVVGFVEEQATDERGHARIARAVAKLRRDVR
jgi:hypothetical protein